MAATVYLTQPQLFPLIVLAQVKLSLLHGNTPVSAGAYARYSFMLCSKQNNISLGYEFGQLALSLSERFANKEISTRVLLMVGALTIPWTVHLKESIPLLQRAYQNGLESGNLDGAALSHFYESQSSYLVGEELQDLAHKIAAYSAHIQQIKQEFHFGNNELLRQVILNLTTRTEIPCTLVGEAFNENKMLPIYQSSSNQLGLYCLYLHKAILSYWFDRKEDALDYITIAANYQVAATSQATVPLFHFYDSLIRLALYDTSSTSEQTSILTQVNENQEKLEFWATHAPMNFQHKYELVLAVNYHCLGQVMEAIDAFDRAVSGAKHNGYAQEEALANELAAKFYLDWGKEKVAADHIQEAYYCYACWGATSKVADLEARYPELLRPILESSASSGDVLNPLRTIAAPTISTHTGTQPSNINIGLNQTFDFASILKASQALSSTIQLDDLLCQLTQVILQNSGADSCALILPNETGIWQVRAVATSGDKTQLYTAPLTNNPNLPVKLIQYVKNTQKIVVIDNSKTDLPVIDDYLIEHQPKSLLCLPLLNQGHLIGILHLKNQLTSGVFTSERITILNILCAQIAISLENARLYQLERHRADQLTASEKRLQTLFDQAADAVFLLEEQRIIDCNQAAVSLLRHPNKAELLELQLDQFSPKRQPDGQLSAVKIKCMLLEASQRCSLGFEWVYQRYDGEDLWAKITLTPIKYRGKIIFHCVARDISDRKKLEKEQSRLTAVIEATPDFIGVASAQGEILWHNTPLRKLRTDLGTPDNHDVISDCHPDWANEIIVNEAIPNAIQNGSWSGELALLDGAGREIPVSQVIIAHKSATGEVENFSTIMRDISDLKQAEVNSRLLASVVESSDDAIITKKLDGTITSWNQAAVDLFGYTETEAIGQPITMLFPAERLQEEPQIIDHIKNKKRVKHFETVRLHKDGSTIDISVTISPLVDSHGHVVGASKIVRDIRDRKAAEKSLKLTQFAVDKAGLGIFYIREDGCFQEVNEAACSNLGYSSEELKGRYVWDISYDMQPHEWPSYWESIKQNSFVRFEGRHQRKDGSIFPVEIVANYLEYDGEGFSFAQAQDISDRKQSEVAILQKTQALENALTDLQNAQLQLVKSEKMSSLGGLVAGVAHEINNPVGCIIGNVDVAQDYFNDLLGLLDHYREKFPQPGADIEDELDAIDLDYVREDLPNLIRAMENAGNRIKSISKSLRTFSRADKTTKQSSNLTEGIESTLLILRHRLKANEHRPTIAVETDYGDIPEINCFPGQLNQVFMNILANAIDMFDEMAQQNTFEDLKKTPQKITIKAANLVEQVEIRISDNGAGMTDKVKSKIFDHLFTTKAAGKGTGLGLAIARQIVVDVHGGSLEADSEVGHGTTFCIQLPL